MPWRQLLVEIPLIFNNRTNFVSRLISFGLLCALIFASGCGDGRPTRVPVSGHVLIDGKPLTYGYVTFVPLNSRASSGGLDKDGKFVLTCFEPNDGVVPGKLKVAVISHEPIGNEALKWHAPKKYADADNSGLSQEITGPTDSITINLTWDGKPGPFLEKQ